MFLKALDRYAEGPAVYMREALSLPKARDVAEWLLHGAVELLTDPRTPRGCLLVQGALSCGKTADPVRRELISRREVDLPAGANAADLARYVVTIIHGMAVQAASGATRKELRRVIQTALRAWPE